MESKESKPVKSSILKLIYIAVITLLMLIPLVFIQKLVKERENNQVDVIQEINQKWGNKVLVEGPILKIPYYKGKSKKTISTEEIEIIEPDENSKYHNPHEMFYVYILPDELQINGNLLTDTLNRNIYESVVYTSDLSLNGHFTEDLFNSSLFTNNTILWDKATIQVLTSNLKGIRSGLKVDLNDTTYDLKSKRVPGKSLHLLETDDIDLSQRIPQNTFKIDLEIAGSQELQFIPLGKETQVKLSSNWNAPSFNGNFLPDPKTKSIDKNGFKAQWKVLQVNRGFEQIFHHQLPNLNYSAFGVNLVVPVDEYHKTERSSKYGYLVIGLTFLVFFLLQSYSKIDIHPIQYVLIGLALCMFYTLLLSISEHTSFLTAYIIASFSVIGLLAIYSRSILNSVKFSLFITTALFVIYSFILVIIQIEAYSLLVGSVGLFLILSSIMILSRKIDWNKSI